MKTMLVLVFLFLSFLVVAGEFELMYSEGTIQQKEGKNWIELIAGDMVRDNATVRLGTDSFAEFEGEMNGGNVFFSIIEEGTYVLKDLITSSIDFRDSGFLAIVSSKVDYLLDNSTDTREAVMGSRGDEEEIKGDGMDWESSEKYLIKGISELEKADINMALNFLEESLELAIETEEPEIYYYTGLAYYRSGLKIKALKTLEKADPKQDEYFFNDYSLLVGSLYLYSRNYKKAIDVLKPVKERELKNKDKQEYYLIQGIGYFKLGKKWFAKINLTKANEIDPDSMIGKSAADLLEKL